MIAEPKKWIHSSIYCVESSQSPRAMSLAVQNRRNQAKKCALIKRQIMPRLNLLARVKSVPLFAMEPIRSKLL
jgi:hypothetical protein